MSVSIGCLSSERDTRYGTVRLYPNGTLPTCRASWCHSINSMALGTLQERLVRTKSRCNILMQRLFCLLLNRILISSRPFASFRCWLVLLLFLWRFCCQQAFECVFKVERMKTEFLVLFGFLRFRHFDSLPLKFPCPVLQ